MRNANDVLNDGEAVSEEDRYIRHRMDYALRVLAEYAKALRNVRASGVLRREEFPYGM